MPESNVQRTAPVAASSATTLCFGVVVVEHAADDDRVGLQAAGLAGVVGPGDLQLPHVGAVDRARLE